MPKSKSAHLSDPKIWKTGMSTLIKHDKLLASVINHYGPISPEMHKNRYEAIIHSLISQQISGSAADSITLKLKKLYNGNIPSPTMFLKSKPAKIRAAGISAQKYLYIKDLCERIIHGDLDLDNIDKLPDEEVISILDNVRGIGRWTAEMFLIFSLGRINVFPADDLGIAKAIQKLYKTKERPKREELDKMSAKWHPYRSIATIYLWRSLENR